MNKKKLIALIIILISFSILSLIGVSYALFTKTVKGEKSVTITSGTLKIDFKEGSTIQLEDARPTEDAEGLEMEPYTFTIENSGDVKAYYNISIKEDESNTLNNNYVRYSLTSDKGYDSGVRVMGGEGSSEFIIKSEDKIEVGDSIQYSLRLWLDKDVDNSVQGQSYKAKVIVNGYSNKTENATEVLLTQFTNDESIQDYDVNYTKEDSTVKENKMYVFRHEKTEQTSELINYRYIGKDPNNYVKFNNELWRIIGVFTIEDENGKKEKRIKLIRSEPLPVGEDNYISWDNKPSGTGSSIVQSGSNLWTDSRLMYLLNPNYENEKEGVSGSIYWNRQSGNCPNGMNNATAFCDFSEVGLLPEAQKMIGKTKWYLGGTEKYTSTDDGLASHFYGYERENKIFQNDNYSKNWIGYIGLMYPSDYGYATSGGITTNRNSCLMNELSNWNKLSDCYNNDWIFYGGLQFTITSRTDHASSIFIVNNDGNIIFIGAYWPRNVNPVIYLTSDVKYSNGDGSQSDPFIFTK